MAGDILAHAVVGPTVSVGIASTFASYLPQPTDEIYVPTRLHDDLWSLLWLIFCAWSRAKLKSRMTRTRMDADLVTGKQLPRITVLYQVRIARFQETPPVAYETRRT